MATQAIPVRHAPAADARTGGASRFDRLALASGIAAAALHLAGAVLFIALVLPELPPLAAPAPERAAFYARMARSAVYRGISFLGELQLLLLLPFFGGLRGILARAEGGSGSIASTVFGAGWCSRC
jgi:hypothetical protein